MHDTCPTVRVSSDNEQGFCVINEADFDGAVHVLFGALAPTQSEGPVLIPYDWLGLHWKARVALAKRLDASVTNDAEAKAAIAAEQARRDVDQPIEAVGGLTMRELRADIAGIGLDVDPTLEAAELLAIRDAARAAA